jgi:hypothetical protein
MMPAHAPDFTYSYQASTDHFEGCAEFALLRNGPSGHWNDDDFDVLAIGTVVGRIFKANASPVGSRWMWTLTFPHHQGRSPTARLCCHPRGRDAGVCQELSAGMIRNRRRGRS